VVVASGDIADCRSQVDEATAKLVGGIDGTVLTLGDNAYPDGAAEDFRNCYEPTWGQFKALLTMLAETISPRPPRRTS
jgi:acid phosphatase type 7